MGSCKQNRKSQMRMFCASKDSSKFWVRQILGQRSLCSNRLRSSSELRERLSFGPLKKGTNPQRRYPPLSSRHTHTHTAPPPSVRPPPPPHPPPPPPPRPQRLTVTQVISGTPSSSGREPSKLSRLQHSSASSKAT